MRNEKSLSRYREEQNMNESDMNLSGFVRIDFSLIDHSDFFFPVRLLFIVQICWESVV
jgi:hypothetical protein